MLCGFTPRLYQETILSTAVLKNTLVVLPTGMGKTGIALLLASQRLKSFPGSKVLVVAPTRPLVEQHFNTFKKFLNLPEKQFVMFTGHVSPEKRALFWKDAGIVFSTPQGLENDIITGSISLKNVSLLVFDEAHRAVGNYSYVFIAKQYKRHASWPRILALTASPGSEVDKIKDVCKNLFVEAVEIRSESDPDVSPYVQDVDFKFVKLDLPPEMLRVKRLLEQCIKGKVSELRKFGVRVFNFSKKDILALQAQIHARIAKGKKNFDLLKAISILAEIMKAHHALELLETQGIAPLIKYLDGLFADALTSKTKAVKNLTADLSFKSAFILAKKLFDSGVEHPKIEAVKDFVLKEVEDNKFCKIILFTQFRDTASKLHEVLESVGILSRVFVGQAKKGNTGLSQKEQAEMLDLFRDGMFNVLIATSVAEEGLDIPKVDVVLFYEPIPSVIRFIQRKGRTGRQEKGRVVVFVTKKTRDEGYLWSAKRKEKKMNSLLEKLRFDLNRSFVENQPSLKSFEKNVKIFADFREKSTGVVKELVENSVNLKLEVLNSADYVLSSRVGVELKTVEDFVDSIVDGRLLEQLKLLKKSFEKPVVVIQGSRDLYGVRNVHPNAIRGMLATVAVSYGIPLVFTVDEKDTAGFLIAVARREQSSGSRDFSPHADRKPLSLKEQQEYIVSAIPGVGPALAKTLLKEFGSVKAVFSADVDALTKVSGVGKKIAESIVRVLNESYLV